MKKRFTVLLFATVLALSVTQALALAPEVAGSPEFEVETVIVQDKLEVYAGQSVTFTALTTYSSNKNENQWLHFVSDRWTGVDVFDETQEAALILETVPAAQPNERLAHFVAAAALAIGSEPGDYQVRLRYEIILQHDESGFRTYETTATTEVLTLTVLEGEPPQEPEEARQDAEALNHGQIVSAWAHWKQTKGNQNFLPGGPTVPRSLNWYKAQVEYLTFHSQQEVWDYLDSIYEPAQRDNNAPNPNKGPSNNNAPNPNKGPGNNNKKP